MSDPFQGQFPGCPPFQMFPFSVPQEAYPGAAQQILNSVPPPPSVFDQLPIPDIDDTELSDVEFQNEDEAKIKYPTDEQGNINPPLSTFDAGAVCEILREKSKLPKNQWTTRIRAGVIVFLIDEKDSRSKRIPYYLSLQSAVELVTFLMQGRMGIFPNAGTTPSDLDTFSAKHPNGDTLDFYNWSSALLKTLYGFIPRSAYLSPNSATTRVGIRTVCFQIILDCMSYLRGKTTKKLENFALRAICNAAELLNSIVSEELRRFSKKFEKPVLPPTPIPIPLVHFNFRWVNGLTRPAFSAHCVQLLIQITALVHSHPEPSKDLSYWDGLCAIATLFFHMCFADEFILHLINSPDCEQLLKAIESVLQLPTSERGFIGKAKYHVLRILTVLGENEEPYFLDHASKIPTSFSIAQLVIKEASRIVEFVPVTKTVDDNSIEAPPVIAREAFRVVELLAYDSNFVSLVVENATLFLLEFLSIPSEQLESYFPVENSFQRYATVLVFRMVANLHCFNPAVSPITHKDQLIKKIFFHCSSIFGLDAENQIVRANNVIVPFLVSNLALLFRKVTESFTFTLQELELWKGFMAELEKQLGFHMAPAKKRRRRGRHVDRRRVYARSSSDEYQDSSGDDNEDDFNPHRDPLSTPTHPPRERESLPTPRVRVTMVEREPREPVERELSSPTGPPKALKGLSVSFGKVTDPVELKKLVQLHGGSVFEYVTKSVTHVICGADREAVQASASKIQSAASKQVPAVSEKLIFDSINAGRVLSEKNYLVSNHPYHSRYIAL